MIESNCIWAVVPVKRFSVAKSRLACVLDPGERRELARAMFEDVLDPLAQCRDFLADIVVVTSDPEAAALARRRGAAVLPDKADRGINVAIAQAIEHIRVRADDGLMMVPSDIPQVTRGAFARGVAAIATAPALAIAAAVEDGGTNLFACRPTAAIPPLFGKCSFEKHRRAAMRAGVAVRILRLPELSLDIDRPENLRTFVRLRSNTRTHGFLSRIRAVERIEQCLGTSSEPLDWTVAGV